MNSLKNIRFPVNIFFIGKKSGKLLFLFCYTGILVLSCGNPKKELTSDTSDINATLRVPEIDIGYITAIQGVNSVTPLNKYFFLHPGEMTEFSTLAMESIHNSRLSPPELFHYAFQMLSAGAGGYGPPLPGMRQKNHIINNDGIFQFLQEQKIIIEAKEEWDLLPFEVQKYTIEFLSAAIEAKVIFDDFCIPLKSFIRDNNVVTPEDLSKALIAPWTSKEMNEFSSIDIIESADIKKLSLATRILAQKLNNCFSLINNSITSKFNGCRLYTPIGDIVIKGKKSDTTKNTQLLLIDLGGNDLYEGNIASGCYLSQPFGFVIDLEGDDIYNCENNFLVASILGISALIDLSGDDHYSTNHSGLAHALYGSAMLYDKSGNDSYTTQNDFGQASAHIGTAILIDLSGDDQYSCGSYSQGFGGTYGAGILYDQAGNDNYNFAAAEVAKTSGPSGFVLGTAKGRWAEATDGHSLAGGTGIFIDYSGNDKYTGGSFAIGASYFFGLGVFHDHCGDDTYEAKSHSFGYAAHFSLASFYESAGDDIYNEKKSKEIITQSFGSGRDFSAGIFLENSGDDTYHFGNRSVGIGDMKGIGLFNDLSGNDSYHWHKNQHNAHAPSMGSVIASNNQIKIGYRIYVPEHFEGKGIFSDLNGNNKFNDHDECKN